MIWVLGCGEICDKVRVLIGLMKMWEEKDAGIVGLFPSFSFFFFWLIGGLVLEEEGFLLSVDILGVLG